MNRRLHTPIIACTAAALALSAGLLFAGQNIRTGAVIAAPAAALNAPAQVQRTATTPDIEPAETPRPRTRRARSGFALPYFSFARGAGGRS